MTEKAILPIPESGFRITSLFVSARTLPEQWSADGSVQVYETVVPKATPSDIDEHDEAFLAGWLESQEVTREDLDASPELRADLAEAFSRSDNYDEWRDSFQPMMDSFWPVLDLNLDSEAAADLMHEFAPCCTLIEFINPDSEDETFALALSGGGMDLSDNVFAAYACCGHVPPLRILEAVRGVMSGRVASRLPIAAIYDGAVAQLRWKVDSVIETGARLVAKAFAAKEPA